MAVKLAVEPVQVGVAAGTTTTVATGVVTGTRGTGGAAGAEGAAVPEDDEVVVVVVVVVVVEAGGVGIVIPTGKAAPPFEAIAAVLIAAKEAGLESVGSGLTLLTKVFKDVEMLVSDAAATF